MVKKLYVNKKILITISVLILVYALFPYVKAEYLTHKHRNEFIRLYSLTNMIDSVEFCKVIDYSETSSKVYYVETGGQITYNVYFSREIKENDWALNHWETVWSNFGSAEDYPWPFYFKEKIF